MSRKEFHYRWEFELRASPQQLWPYVADTNRFNRDAGLPGLTRPDGAHRNGARRRLGFKRFGVDVAWEEEPFEWIRPYRFGVVRHYSSGPVAEARVAAELKELEGGGTRLVYEVWAAPRGALGRAAIPVQVGRVAARRFAAAFRRYDALAAGGGVDAPPSPAPRLTGERALLEALRRKVLEAGEDEGLVARLFELVERGDELTLARLRPYALADEWGVARRAALELCLKATRAGLLDLRWELICPLCRGAGESAEHLKDVRPDAHCESCDVSFDVDFDRSVEVVFRPNAAVRKIEAREFCVGGPQTTPHVVVQQLTRPGERREVRPLLEPGRHRLRTNNLPDGQLLFASDDGGEAAAEFRAREEGWPDVEPHVSTHPRLTLVNATDREQLFVLERMRWGEQAATAHEVTALQLFRDLFASEALRPGDRINVGQMTILFTDLRDSTRLYREIGDAVAFGTVMSHFDVLREQVAAEGGAIVKTLGDAIMGVFPRPAPAIRAAMRAQAALASPPTGGRPLRLKAGIHTGPCIAVTLNERLDYFGSNVNIAARLEPLSTGADCVISSDVRLDPEVAEMLDNPACDLASELLETNLKGFVGESFQLWRVMHKEQESEA
ncbi:MAG TPA: DUF5939 domain-containing protein [Pyrinomonadaceae bacterium]|nr:DUF5939 domain-containing protein [Pyrinomonadaceae bacterium]